MVNIASATRNGIINEENLVSLSLPGLRTVESFGSLFPGVAPPPQTISQSIGPGIGSSVGTSGQFVVNGLRSRANNFTVDGSDNNDEDIGVRRQGFTSLSPQTVESIQEYQITTLLPTSQFGRNLGGQVNLVSSTGGTRFHGALYWFFTNDKLKARDFFDLTDGTDGPPNFPISRASDNVPVIFNDQPLAPANPVGNDDAFNRRQIGFVFGGPIGKQEKKQNNTTPPIPPAARKTLFFTSFEHQAVDANKESHFAVPAIAERGLFSSGDRGQRNPSGAVPPFLYPTSATGDRVFSLYPFPNNPRGPYGANTFTQILPADARGTIFSLRLDRAIDPLMRQDAGATRNDQSVAARYNFTDDDTVLPVTGGAIASSLRALVRTQNLSLYHIANFSSKVTNELRASYGRTSLVFREVRNPAPLFLQSKRFPDEPFLLNAQVVTNATLPGLRCNENPKTFPGQPCFKSEFTETEEEGSQGYLGALGQLIVSGYSPVGVDVFNFPQQRTNNTFQYADTLFSHWGDHRIITGFDFRRTQLNSKLDRNFRPLAVFSGAPDIAPSFGFPKRSPNGYYLGSDFAAAGAPTGFFQTLALVPDSTIGLRYWQLDFFATDEIRLRSGLTLTIGARYQYNTVPGEVNRRIEATFTSPQITRLIEEERKLTNGISGFDRFLAGRTKIFNGDRNNIAPHLAFAWDAFGRGDTSIRGGYGIYYDQIPGAVTSQSRNVFPSFLTINTAGLIDPDLVTSTSFAPFNPSSQAVSGTLNTFNQKLACPPFGTDRKPFGADLVAFLLCLNSSTAPIRPGEPPRTFPGGPGFVLPAADLRTPYSQHWGLTVEHEFKRDYLLSIAYVGTRGVHLLRFATPNLGLNVIPVVTGVQPMGFEPLFQGFTVAPAQKTDSGLKFERPFPLLGSFTSIESDASSTYHGLQAEFNKRLSHGIQFTTAYTWSHAIDEVSDLFDLAAGPMLPQNSFDRRAERADASFDIRHSFVYSLVWDLSEIAKKKNRLLKLLKGWRVSSIGAFRTGQPFTLLACCDVNLDGNLSDRLNTVMGIERIDGGRTRFRATGNPFSLLAEAGRDGALGRNTFRAPGTASIDLAVSKTVEFENQLRFELRAEFFNLFNRTHFGVPVHQLLFPGFGQSVDTRLPARTIQIAGKFSF